MFYSKQKHLEFNWMLHYKVAKSSIRAKIVKTAFLNVETQLSILYPLFFHKGESFHSLFPLVFGSNVLHTMMQKLRLFNSKAGSSTFQSH